jgi:hypothetical protein
MCLPLFVAACATTGNTNSSIVEYGCKDVVLLGRVTSITYSDKISEEERCIYTTDGECITWRGLYELDITVKKVFIGDEARAIVPAFYIAHGQIRSDVDFVFVLMPTDERYELKRAYISDVKSINSLAESCSSAD